MLKTEMAWKKSKKSVDKLFVYLSVDNELSILSRNVTLEDAVGGVVFEHVDHVVKIDEGIVDGNDVDVISGQGSSADESNKSN